MTEENIRIGKVPKYTVESTIFIVGVISSILTIIYYQLYEMGMETFILGSVAGYALVSSSAIDKYKNKIANKTWREKYPAVLKIVWDYTRWSSIVFIIYRICFSEYILHDKYYSSYKYIMLYILISFTLINVNMIYERAKILIKEKVLFSKHWFYILGTAWILIDFLVSSMLVFYMPKKVLDLSNVSKPYYLSISEFKYKGSKLSSVNRYKDFKIEDEEILESFKNELSKAPIEDIRGFDYLNYTGRKDNESFFFIHPYYKDSNGKNVRLQDVDKMDFLLMIFHRNGELILEYYRYDFLSHIFLKYGTNMYRVNLSQELTNQIIELYERGK